MQDDRSTNQRLKKIEPSNRDCIMFTDELSEEELEQLITSVESEGLLGAPQYLKENLLMRIEQEEQMIQVSSRGDSLSTKSSRSKKLQLTLYSMKVVLAAAAAIALVFLIPFAGDGMSMDKQSIHEQQKEYEQMQENYPSDYQEKVHEGKKSSGNSLYKSTNSFCSKLLEKTNQIFK